MFNIEHGPVALVNLLIQCQQVGVNSLVSIDTLQSDLRQAGRRASAMHSEGGIYNTPKMVYPLSL